MGSRNRTVGTKLSDDEYAALVAVCGAEHVTRSAWMADAVADALRAAGALTSERICRHPPLSRTRYKWGERCNDCNTVLNGKYAEGSLRP